MNRREWIVGAGAVALASVAKAAPTGKEKPAAEHHHEAPAAGLVDAASDCHKKAELCLSHCIGMLSTGDTSMAACAARVRDTLASSEALLALASSGSKHAKPLAKVCADICRDCEAECRKHADKMPVCKDCADACAKMIQEVSKLPA
jgi:Cys-rich four helix bundle protein (predicted Tat secretion target)